MTTDADDALIAKLLAEDNIYSYQGTFEDCESDDTEHGHSKRRKKAKRRGDPRIRAPVSTGREAPRDKLEVTATGRRKRKDHGAAREAGKTWSDDEERLFLEALDLHGEASSHQSHHERAF